MIEHTCSGVSRKEGEETVCAHIFLSVFGSAHPAVSTQSNKQRL